MTPAQPSVIKLSSTRSATWKNLLLDLKVATL
jgi:hypothetical protein